MSMMDALLVEIELTSGEWTDITEYTNVGGASIDTHRGRANAWEQVSTGTLTLVLNNFDGRFTPMAAVLTDDSTNPYHPNLRENKRVRVRVAHGNLIASSSTFEESTDPWYNTTFGWDTTTLTVDATYAQQGTNSVKCEFPASVNGTAGMVLVVDGLTVGQEYTFSLYGRSNTGEPDWRLTMYGGTPGSVVSTKNAMTRGTVTFTATDESHTLCAYATTYGAGDLIYWDAAQLDLGDTALAYRDDGGIFSLFTGYIDSISAEFPGGYSGFTFVQIETSDRFKVLARRQLQGVYEEVARFAGASAFYPLTVTDETSGTAVTDSIRQGGVATIVPPAFNTAGTYTWSSEDHPAQLDGALIFSGSADVDAGYGAGVVDVPPLPLSGDYTCSVAFWFKTTDPGDGLELFTTPFANFGLDGADALYAAHGSSSATTAGAVNDGEWHLALGVCELSGGGTTQDVTLYLDGALVGTDSAAATADAGTAWILNGGYYQSVNGNIYIPAKAFSSRDVAYAGLVLSTSDISAHAADLYAAGADGLFGETVAARATRILGWAGVDVADQDVSDDMSAVIGTQDVDGKSALEALLELGVAENAPVFIKGDGTVRVAGRGERATLDPVVTFDGTASEIEVSSLAPTLADEGIVNQVVGQVTGGAAATVYISDVMSDTMTDSMSSSPLSPISATVDAPWSTVAQADDAAAMYLLEHYEAHLRVARVVLTPSRATADIWPACLALEIGDLIRITGLPQSLVGPSTQIDLHVESLAWSIAGGDATLTLDTTALDRAVAQVIFDDDVTGRFTHDSGVMTVDTVGCLSGTGTGTFTIATSSGPLWTVTAGDYPLDVKIGEEEITLSAMSGGTSPQTATVSVRGANGTSAYAHATASPVELWPIPVFAH